MKLKIARSAAVIVIVLSMAACVKPTIITSTSQPPFAATPANQSEELVIASTNSFVDTNGTYHVIGNVVNYGSAVVNSIELVVEIKDASGNSLLLNENGGTADNTSIYPMLYTLVPGQASPFEFSYETSNGTPASFNVTIASFQIGNANRAALQWEKVQIVDNGSGWYYLTGVLVNMGAQWAYVNSLAGAVLDDSNRVLSTDWTSTYTTELAPAGDVLGRDRTPFEVNFPNPGGSTQWELYWDADVIDNVNDYPMEVKVTNLYFDQYGSAHLIGWVTNNSNQSLDSLVVGGLYSADGTVLDSSYAFVPVPIKPGAAAPFSISSFGSVNYNPNQASLVTTSTAQFDSWFTTPTSSEFVELTATGETVHKEVATWTFSGNFINTSGRDLSYATVVVMVMDGQNKLIAMEYVSVSPTGEAIVSGEPNPYSVTVYLDPAADATGFTTTTVVVGDVKQ